MAALTPDDMAAKLLAEGFERSGPVAAALTDPIADTPMVVTLDQLRPYEHNPRVTRNPRYDDLKASIRERGLDAPPAITRRPGETHYIIRNGGNTRLAILNELWTETHDERFFRIPCLFRPWSPRGEIIALTGHLAENELHGALTFIERALAVEKARELYEQESGTPLSQSELARRLTGDGYPTPQPHISRMQEAVRHLLPAIPTLLYGGLGRPQVERLVALRRAAARTWEQRAGQGTDFATLFQDVLALFDGDVASFTVQRMQDELIGQMAERLDIDYDALSLDLEESETRQRALSREPAAPPDAASSHSRKPSPSPDANVPSSTAAADDTAPPPIAPSPSTQSDTPPSAVPNDDADSVQQHIVSPAPDTGRLQALRQLVAEHTGDDTPPDFAAMVIQAVPVQAGGLYPISDVWVIAPTLDDPQPLRTHIAQLAREIAAEADMDACVVATDQGIGYRIDDANTHRTSPLPFFARAVRGLLLALTLVSPETPAASADTAFASLRLADDLAPLLLGGTAAHPLMRLSDAALVKLYRLVRLARRLHDHLNAPPGAAEGTHGAS
ncbi:ParB domain-containing protein nuclease [Burkholderia pseudomallei]|uniref:ParB family protein n=1 Tax=Burkholderia pseudomallei TaxID=28450 RepID=UPI000F06B57B|nr:ParB family protein [Burkholderia pseudomallei]CAJ2758320.1 ParB domain-containing protein nuclease [Burkholderia pseudomallei]VCJ93005.1 ParB domain-containing protein nuclease [Burkholderia pseudomallei]VCJ95307.1 ParB domain-containing protein nuclease [Burkholderia pseudomallei]VCJ95387.1 ParB domain-containing protein nuclease [Burkholderia pseudomallei]VCJ98013.1 ParB domain-containing protein nuclease [Burkholderia pseudomallei]